MQAGQPALAWYIEIVVSCVSVTRVTSACVSEYWLESSKRTKKKKKFPCWEPNLKIGSHILRFVKLGSLWSRRHTILTVLRRRHVSGSDGSVLKELTTLGCGSFLYWLAYTSIFTYRICATLRGFSEMSIYLYQTKWRHTTHVILWIMSRYHMAVSYIFSIELSLTCLWI